MVGICGRQYKLEVIKKMIEQKLKSLETQKTKYIIELSGIDNQKKELMQRATELENKIRKINNQINSLYSKEDGVIFTEHSILRYLERIEGIDIEKIKSKIVDKKTEEIIKTIGSGKISVNGFYIVFKNKKIITVSINKEK
jgi:hypothetical protein